MALPFHVTSSPSLLDPHDAVMAPPSDVQQEPEPRFADPPPTDTRPPSNVKAPMSPNVDTPAS
eukprot:CAMPEP_0178700470 /NCGR_PEP_ID=MMETSP0699-20121125/11693_1 /TAXON_ID=265572 /ORGANISM="Extubocellulus spinifer, Strain CCMP396" /LENGTH=62 /DNA_ID=CAMNT_0020346811 /DNA_START=376 /DNA_END=564 /DNA_ORIENTATION=+